jgi:hypothetical protein
MSKWRRVQEGGFCGLLFLVSPGGVVVVVVVLLLSLPKLLSLLSLLSSLLVGERTKFIAQFGGFTFFGKDTSLDA